MRIVLFIFLMLSGFLLQAQVQLPSIKKSDVKFKIPIAQRTIPGQTGYFQEYGDLAVLMDSVGISEGVIIDSLKYNETTDSLTLYTSTGNYKAYIPQPASGVTGSGTATRAAFWSGTSTLSSDDLFYWNNTFKNLGLGTNSPSSGARLHVADGDMFIIGGSNRRFLMGSSVSQGFWGGMRWNTSNQLQYIHSGYSDVTGVMLTTSDGYTGLRTAGTTPLTPLDVFSSSTSDNGTYQNWAYSAAPTSYRLLLKQTVTGGNVRYNFSQVNAGTPYDNVMVLDRGNVCLGCTDASRKLHVAGELRVTDLITDTPTKMIAADNDGDFGTATIGTGLTFSGGTLSNSGDLSTTNELQTLSWSNPNLSISSGNSVTLPVLPSASSSQTLAYLSGTWTPSSFLKTNSSTTASGNSKRVTINDDIGGESWPLSINTATKFLVNGKVQMNSTSSGAVTSIMGRNDIMEVGSVTIGSDMQLTSGILSKRQVLGVLARNSSSSTFSTSSTPAKLDFNVTMVQVNATASTGNDDIVTTITSYGAYEINCDCQFNPGATATYNFGIYVNGSLNGSLVKQIPMTSGVTHDVSIFGYVSSLATTDEIDIRVSTGSGTSGNTIGRCMLALKGI